MLTGRNQSSSMLNMLRGNPTIPVQTTTTACHRSENVCVRAHAFSDDDHDGMTLILEKHLEGYSFLGDKLVSWMSKKTGNRTAMSSA
ncbi:hypothetical protein Tco_1448417 [Tanacetum coccineum]